MAARLYVDGFNMYHAIAALGDPALKWLNLWALGETLVTTGEPLQSVVYFTALMTWDRGKHQRHSEYIKALRAVGVEVVVAKFMRVDKHCVRFDRTCKFLEEKQTDVGIAARILVDAAKNPVKEIVIVTADSDQVPTFAALRALTPNTQIVVATPPGRAKTARELGAVAHVRREIGTGRLRQCLLPRNVESNGRTVAICPATYYAVQR